MAAWRGLNAALPAIHPKDEYTLYQSMVGAWPAELAPDDAAGLERLRERLEGWLLKSLREAKERSDWNEPDQAYEQRALGFLRSMLSPGGALPQAVGSFVRRIAPAGLANSLAQLLLKLTAPGVPDIYQGTELWDFSLVDPDNRRPVDFALRARLLAEPGPEGHGPKLDLLARGLALRARCPELFARGRYHPLAIEGTLAPNLLAFGRVMGEQVAITVVARRLGRELVAAGTPALGQEAWRDTTLPLPRSWWTLGLRDQLLQEAELEVRDGPLGAGTPAGQAAGSPAGYRLRLLRPLPATARGGSPAKCAGGCGPRRTPARGGPRGRSSWPSLAQITMISRLRRAASAAGMPSPMRWSWRRRCSDCQATGLIVSRGNGAHVFLLQPD